MPWKRIVLGVMAAAAAVILAWRGIDRGPHRPAAAGQSATDLVAQPAAELPSLVQGDVGHAKTPATPVGTDSPKAEPFQLEEHDWPLDHPLPEKLIIHRTDPYVGYSKPTQFGRDMPGRMTSEQLDETIRKYKMRPRKANLTDMEYHLDDPRVRELWLAAFHDPDPRNRVEAPDFHILLDWVDLEPRLVQETLQMAKTDPRTYVRRQATGCLIDYEQLPEVFEFWLSLARTASDPAAFEVFGDNGWGATGNLTNDQLQKMFDATKALITELRAKPPSQDNLHLQGIAMHLLKEICDQGRFDDIGK